MALLLPVPKLNLQLGNYDPACYMAQPKKKNFNNDFSITYLDHLLGTEVK